MSRRLRARRSRRCSILWRGLEPLEPRQMLSADSVVVFNELMYHPAGDADETLEWVELHNQMSVDVDISRWRLSDGIDFQFPVGTVVPGGGYIVVAADPAALQAATGYAGALGPFTGRLANNGENINLRNNSDRLMDAIEYGDGGDWPVGPDGSGATLAKVNPRTASAPAGNWTHSTQLGGTPGAVNFPSGADLHVDLSLIEPGDAGKLFIPTDGSLGSTWTGGQVFDDTQWVDVTTGIGYQITGGGGGADDGDDPIGGGSTVFTGPGGSGVPARQSSIIDVYHYSESWTIGPTATITARQTYTPQAFPLSSAVAVLENTHGNTGQTWGTFVGSIARDNSNNPGGGGYPGGNGAGTATGFLQRGTSGSADVGVPYGLSNDFIVQADTLVASDRVNIFTGPTVGNFQTVGSLAVFFRHSGAAGAQIGVYAQGFGEVNTGLTSGLTATDLRKWHNFAVHFDLSAKTLEFFVDEVSRGTFNYSASFPGYTVSNAAVSVGSSGNIDRLWMDNFQVGGDEAPPPPPEPHLDPGNIADPPPGLVTFIDFDEAAGEVEGRLLNFAYDRVGTNNGSFIGQATRTAGLVGLGAGFFNDTSGTGVDIGTGAGGSFSVTSGVSIEAVFATDWSGGDQAEIFRKEDGNNRLLLSLQSGAQINNSFGRLIGTAGVPGISLGLNIGGSYGELDVAFDGLNGRPSLAQINNNSVHHVVGTYDAATGIQAIYLDGVLLGSVDLANGLQLTSGGAAAAIIGNLNSGGEPFDGTIDEFAFWNRALTPEEIALHHINVQGGQNYFAEGDFPYDNFIDTNIEGQMQAVNSSAYLRMPFTVPANVALDRLTLHMKYDDGFVAYINGVEVARRNAPASLPFDAAATMERANSENISFETISLNAFLGAVVPGQNILAIHGLNVDASDNDFLLLPALDAEGEQIVAGSSPLRINEVAAFSTPVFRMELRNDGTTAMDVAGHIVVRDDGTTQDQYVLGSMVVPAGGFVELDETALGFEPGDGDRLYLFAPGGTSLLDARVVTGSLRGRSDRYGDMWLFPQSPTPGAANTFSFTDDVVINEIMYHAQPDYGDPGTPGTFTTTTLLPISATWRYNDRGQDLGAGWQNMVHPVDGVNWRSGQALIGFEPSALPEPIRTAVNNPVNNNPYIPTYYFETEFEFNGNLADVDELQINHIIDDGAVFYLNGVEVLRYNLPGGTISYSTFAPTGIDNATYSGAVTIPSAALVVGTNRLSVEVHQTNLTSSDVVFGATVLVAEETTPAVPPTPFTESDEEFIELYNRGATTVDLTGWELNEAVQFTFPAGTMIGPGEYLVIARDAAEFSARYPGVPVLGQYDGSLANSNDLIRLDDANKNPADIVHYYDGGRWNGYADGGGSSLELRDPFADNSKPEAWAPSIESDASEWQTITYQGPATNPPGSNNPTTYNEFILGLLDDGEVLIDDVRVVRDPAGAAVQLIQNGSFEAGNTDKWRIVGNHHGTVITDPTNPLNKVLHLKANGPEDHLQNHAETTLKNGGTFEAIQIGATYEISFRAKWINGSPQVISRLFFNLLPRTTILDTPRANGTPGAANSRHEANIGPTYSHLAQDTVTPLANEIIGISVHAEDPDGVASMTLRYAVNGGAFSNVAMTHLGGGQYTGDIPGQNANAIIQFYVEGMDTLGATSTYPADGAASRALIRVQPSVTLSNDLQNFQIIMTSADSALLNAPTNLMSNDSIGATLIYEGEIYYNVGIRLKGSEHGRPNTLRRSYFVYFDPDNLFRGAHDSIAFDRSGGWRFGTQFGQDEILINHFINQAGNVPGMYNDLAFIDAPGVSPGTAILQMARFTDTFLDSQYENGADGDQYEYELVYTMLESAGIESLKYAQEGPSVFGVNVGSINSADDEAYRHNFLLKNRRAEDDFSAARDLAALFRMSGQAFLDAAPNVIDVDQWLRSFAALSLSGANDNYNAGSQHNAVFYQRPEDGRILLFPFDMDFAFILSTSQPLSSSGDLNKLIASPHNNHFFLGHLEDIIDVSFNTSYMSQWVTHYDNLLPGQDLSSILTWIGQRAAFVLSQMPAMTAFNITTPGSPVVNDVYASVTGTGWVNVREIRLAGSDQPIETLWTTTTAWQAQVPVAFGEHDYTLEAYDFQGNLIGTRTITITSTLSERPLVDFLRVTEVHFNPAAPTAAEVTASGVADAQAYEFIELKNISEGAGAVTIDLTDAAFTAGISFDFATGAVTSLGPGQYVVLVKNQDAFEARYGTGVMNIAGVFGGQLANGGEQLVLRDTALDLPIQDFEFGDSFVPVADGDGYSMDIIDPTGDVAEWSTAEAWRSGGMRHGTPGRAHPSVGTLPGDANYNMVVDINDLSRVAVNFGLTNSQWDLGDFNGDGVTNITDLSLLATFFGAMAMGGGDGAAIEAAAPADTEPSSSPASTKPAVILTPLAAPVNAATSPTTWRHIDTLLGDDEMVDLLAEV